MYARINGTTSFKEAKFSGYAGFMNTIFTGYTGFKSAFFSNYANFTNATFLNEAIFDSGEFVGIALFNNVKFSGEAGFNSIKFSDIVSFKNATFSEHAGFTGTNFLKSTTFKDAKFILDTHFNNVNFNDTVDFMRTTFSGNTEFIDTNFHAKLVFFRANFSGNTRFNRSKFFGNSDFTRIIFSENLDFFRCRFLGIVDFFSSKFSGNTFFKEVIFSDDGRFTKVKFFKLADFSDTSFEKKGSFKNAFINYARFHNTEFRHVIFDEVDLTIISFAGSILEDSYISNSNFGDKILLEELEACYGRKICKNCKVVIHYPSRYIIWFHKFFRKYNLKFMYNSRLIEIINKLQKLTHKPLLMRSRCRVCGENLSGENINENEEYIDRNLMFKKAEEVYRKIKLSLQNEGEYTLAGDFYYREMKMRRKKQIYNKKIGSWLLSHIYSKVCGYGEKTIRVIILWFAIIALFGLLYQTTGTLDPDKINNNFDYYYFSVVTFTTLGFGDLHPVPSLFIGKIAAMTEAILGAFMIALFVLVFGRKMLR